MPVAWPAVTVVVAETVTEGAVMDPEAREMGVAVKFSAKSLVKMEDEEVSEV